MHLEPMQPKQPVRTHFLLISSVPTLSASIFGKTLYIAEGLILSLPNAVNKQLNDKERVAAALENPTLLEVIEDCLSPTFA